MYAGAARESYQSDQHKQWLAKNNVFFAQAITKIDERASWLMKRLEIEEPGKENMNENWNYRANDSARFKWASRKSQVSYFALTCEQTNKYSGGFSAGCFWSFSGLFSWWFWCLLFRHSRLPENEFKSSKRWKTMTLCYLLRKGKRWNSMSKIWRLRF